MALPTHSTPRWRLGLAAAVGVLSALTAAGAAASTPTVHTQARTTPPDTSPRTPFPGFLLDQGRYTTIEAPEPGVQQYPFDINDHGLITGEYVRVGPDQTPDSESGFVRDARGRTSVFDVPGAQGTEASKINNRGQIVGGFSLDTPIVNDSAALHGFLRDGDRFTRIDVPGAQGTEALGVNDHAQVVGAYADAAGTLHGYLWDKGRFTTIDVPGAALTSPTDINNDGQIVGRYIDAAGAVHGYLWDNGRVVTIDVPGDPLTTAEGIDDRGRIVGYSADDADLTGARGYLLAEGAKGPFTPISYPGAPRTAAEGLNNRGQIVGFYENPDATPNPQLAET